MGDARQDECRPLTCHPLSLSRQPLTCHPLTSVGHVSQHSSRLQPRNLKPVCTDIIVTATGEHIGTDTNSCETARFYPVRRTFLVTATARRHLFRTWTYNTDTRAFTASGWGGRGPLDLTLTRQTQITERLTQRQHHRPRWTRDCHRPAPALVLPARRMLFFVCVFLHCMSWRV